MKVIDFINQQNFYFPVIGCRVLSNACDLLEAPDEGMKCNITNIIRDPSYDDDEYKGYKVFLDFTPYEEYNKAMAVPSFWDSNGEPTLTWFESKYYTGKEDFILEANEDIDYYFDFNVGTWREQVNNIKQCNQRQDSTTDQLKDLIVVANKLGFYDAADYLKKVVNE